MAPLVVPVLHDGQLWGHAFLRMELEVKGDIWNVRKKVHNIQDALVRAAYMAPLVINGPVERIGKPKPSAFTGYIELLHQEAAKVVGEQADGILLDEVMLRPL